LVSTSDDWTVRVWDVARRKERFVLTGHEATIPGLAVSPDGATAASAGRDCTIRLWDLRTGACLRTLTGHADDVMDVAFSPDGQRLASVSYDKSVKLWNLGTGSEERTFVGHTDWIFCVTFVPGGSVVVTGGGDGVRTWNLATGQCERVPVDEQNVSSLAFVLDGSWLAASAADGSVRVSEAFDSNYMFNELWSQHPARGMNFAHR
jgi:WD40 repeat protein